MTTARHAAPRNKTLHLLILAVLAVTALVAAWAVAHPVLGPLFHWAMHYHGRPAGMHYFGHVVGMHFHG